MNYFFSFLLSISGIFLGTKLFSALYILKIGTSIKAVSKSKSIEKIISKLLFNIFNLSID